MKNAFSVEIKTIRLTWPDNRPYIVGWGDGCGFGAATLAEALSRAEQEIPKLIEGRAWRGVAGACVEISRFCETCKVTGIKPGCKRKKCPACKGRGTVGLFGFPILKEGVEP